MNKTARMLLLNSGRKDNDNHERRGGNGTYMGHGRDDRNRNGDYRDDYMGERDVPRYDDRRYDNGGNGGVYGDVYRPEPQNAYYDDRGRRHYDDGRYAPMATAGMPYRQYPMRPYPTVPASPGMRMNGNGRWDEDEPYRDTKMGFMRYGDGYTFEMDSDGDKIRGNVIPIREERKWKEKKNSRNHSKEDFEPLTEDTAKQWARNMQNEDGTKGPHWTMEQTSKVMRDMKEDFDEIDFWLAMNATYSDMCKEFRKYNIDKPEAYADFAIAFWLCDDDAVEDKLSAYYEFITTK